MHSSSYNIIGFEVNASEEFLIWFKTLDDKSKEAVHSRIVLLEILGPNLSRPYSDVLHGSKKCSNLKELRTSTETHELRIAYYFDPKRKAFLLTGGDKKGKNQKRFYKNLISEAEKIIEKHEENLEDI